METSIIKPETALFFGSLGGKELIDFQPVHERVEPFVAGSVRVSEAEAVAAILVKMKFYRLSCLVPRLDHTKLSAEKKIIRGNYIEHWRCVRGYFNRPHSTVYRTDKIQVHQL